MSLIKNMSVLNMQDRSLAFWGLGQVGVVIEGPDGIIYLDPYLTDSDGAGGHLPREFPPPLTPKEADNADAVLLTHDHADHTDPDTLLPMAKASPHALLVGPYTSRDKLVEAGLDEERLIVPTVEEPFEVAGATVTVIPSAHTGLEHNPERGYPYFGYVIEWNGVTVYHAGDTIIYDGLIENLSKWDLNIAFIPINGRDWFRTSQGIIGNTNIQEVAELAEELDIDVIIPTHYDLIAANAVDPGHFVSYLYQLNRYRSHKILRPGELFYFVREAT
jgi:L-ascorbate 6-phosphate lactonase